MRHLILLTAIPALIACADSQPAAQDVATVDVEANEPATAVASEVETADAFDFSVIPSGTYMDEDDHAYIQFSYDHQGYSRPVLRWSEFDATVEYDAEAPENSTLAVTIPVASIDSMVPKFNAHLKSDDFFDVETYPTISFRSTSVNVDPDGTGTITGDLTIKDITRPITLEGRLNKAGQHSSSGDDMFGISGTGILKRSDFDVDIYVPMVGDEVELVMEIEFRKAE